MSEMFLRFCCLGFIFLVGLGCARREHDSIPNREEAPERIECPGLHNVFRVTDRLYSGSSPEGDAGFESLRKLGIKTVLTVDGAKPDVERARRFGLRYVHLPIGYDGIQPEQALRLARAARDLPGPIYVHCHHGQHRAPAAVAVVRRCLDKQCSAEAAVAYLRQAGADPHYTGLYAASRRQEPLSIQQLDAISDDFPEVAPLPAFAEMMVSVDACWDRLKAARKAGWRTPADDPDLDSPHEALQLVEHYREAERSPDVAKRSEEFRGFLAEARTNVQGLESALRELPKRGEASGVEKAFKKAGGDCTRCHLRYRDVPQ